MSAAVQTESVDDLHSDHEDEGVSMLTPTPVVTLVPNAANNNTGEVSRQRVPVDRAPPTRLAPPAVPTERRWSESRPSPVGPTGHNPSNTSTTAPLTSLLDTSIGEVTGASSIEASRGDTTEGVPVPANRNGAPLSIASLDRTVLIPGRPPLSPPGTTGGGMDRMATEPAAPALPEASVQFAAAHTPPRALRPDNSMSQNPTEESQGSHRRRNTSTTNVNMRQSQSASGSSRHRDSVRNFVLRDDLPLVDIQLQPLRLVSLSSRHARESISGAPTDSSRRSSAGLRQSYLSSNSMLTVAAGRQTRPTSPSHFDPPRTLPQSGEGPSTVFITGRDLERMERAQHARAAARVAAEQQLRGWPSANVVLQPPQRATSSQPQPRSHSRVNGQRVRGQGAARGKNVYLGGLPPGTTEEILRLLCEPYGVVVSTVVLIRAERRFGFVLMGTVEAATIVINQLNGHVLEGHRMHARFATNAPRTASPQAPGVSAMAPRQAPVQQLAQPVAASMTPPTPSVSPSSSAGPIGGAASSPNTAPIAVQQTFAHPAPHPAAAHHPHHHHHHHHAPAPNVAYVASGPGGQRYLLVPQSQSWQYSASASPYHQQQQSSSQQHYAVAAAQTQALANERNSLLQRVAQLESQLRALTTNAAVAAQASNPPGRPLAAAAPA